MHLKKIYNIQLVQIVFLPCCFTHALYFLLSSRMWWGRKIVSLNYWLYWESDFSGSLQNESPKDLGGRVRWHFSIPCVLAQWDLGKDLENWALAKQGSHCTLLLCPSWWDEVSHQAAAMLADAGLFHLASDLPKGESHLLTQRCGAGGEAARREGACSGTDVVVSFHFFSPSFFPSLLQFLENSQRNQSTPWRSSAWFVLLRLCCYPGESWSAWSPSEAIRSLNSFRLEENKFLESLERVWKISFNYLWPFWQ